MLLEASEDLWTGKTSTREAEHHPFAGPIGLEELAPGVAFYKAFVNLTAISTDDGLVLVDTGSYHPRQHGPSFEAVRAWTTDPLHTAVYTHGHVDHAYGLPPYMAEVQEKGARRPQIIGHVDVAPRMQRYIETAGWNSAINSRQFGVPIQWPVDPIPPTVTYEKRLEVRVGDRLLQLHHARGETDDHTWVFIPDRRVLCTGDLFIWAAPNAGNPQKVQRFAIDWAQALRAMAALEPELLLPGHGLPIAGAARVREALTDTADYLESLYRQTVAAMNDGATIYEILEAVAPPASLAERPYLQPVYDEPDFIVRNVYRCLGGWHSGVPSELKPAPRSAQAREIAELAGGVGRLLERAAVHLDAGELRLACHLVDWAAEVEPASTEVHALRARVYQARTSDESSTMSRGVFGAAARESSEKAGS
jgi:alkyl sulfatase BDS1-like metallo-beta-lactamase superfamily hydrolase